MKSDSMTSNDQGTSSGDPSITTSARRDPEDRPAMDREQRREKMLDNTIADSFPNSDPPSTIRDPSEADPLLHSAAVHRRLLIGLARGSWAAIWLEEEKVVGTGPSPDDAEQDARQRGFPNVELVQVPEDAEAPSSDAA